MNKHEKYNRSDKGRARSVRYNQTPAGRARQHRYDHSAKGQKRAFYVELRRQAAEHREALEVLHEQLRED